MGYALKIFVKIERSFAHGLGLRYSVNVWAVTFYWAWVKRKIDEQAILRRTGEQLTKKREAQEHGLGAQDKEVSALRGRVAPVS